MSDRQSKQSDSDDPRGAGAWIAALILIGVGLIFLFQNMGYAIPGNWWALFILIPAAYALAGAWKAYERNGRRFGSAVVGPLITGIVLVALTLMFLFDLDVDWNVIWPAVLIVIGVLALGRAYSRR